MPGPLGRELAGVRRHQLLQEGLQGRAQEEPEAQIVFMG